MNFNVILNNYVHRAADVDKNMLINDRTLIFNKAFFVNNENLISQSYNNLLRRKVYLLKKNMHYAS